MGFAENSVLQVIRVARNHQSHGRGSTLLHVRDELQQVLPRMEEEGGHLARVIQQSVV